MSRPPKPSPTNDLKVETVLDRLHSEANQQSGVLLLHYLPKLPNLFLGKGIQWDETKTEFYCDKYIPIERDQGDFLYLMARSLNAKTIVVPYLGYNSVFNLKTEPESSVRDPRNPKRIGISKIEKITFYKTAVGKSAIARNCEYIYMGAAPDPKYYQEFKAAWDLFELVKDEAQDPNCRRFQYLTLLHRTMNRFIGTFATA